MKSSHQSGGPLSPDKRRLLAAMLSRKGVRLQSTPGIRRRVEEGPCPLSFAQERTWFFEQLEPGTAAYNVPAAVRLSGVFNAEALRQTLTEIVRRHHALRTNFRQDANGIPFQVTAAAKPVDLPVVDLSGLHPAGLESILVPLLRREIERPFNLETGLLLRWMLFRINEGDYVALLVTHHIASDGWSIHLLFGELAGIYKAFATGEQSSLGELAIQYSDFAGWQRDWFRGQVLADLLDYWKQSLGSGSTSSIAPDYPARTARTLRGRRSAVLLSPELTIALNQLCITENVTLFMLLLAAFKTLMYRLSWHEEISVGSPIANRNRSETESLIGFFVNTLVLRTKLEGNPEFRELLQRVKEVTVGAYDHQDMPFDQLVDAFHLKRDIREHPLFQVFFALNNNPVPSVELPGVLITPFPIDNGVAKFDIEISLIERDQGITATAIFNADLFESSSIELLLARYEKLLREIVRNPRIRLLDIDLEDGSGSRNAADSDALETGQFIFE